MAGTGIPSMPAIGQEGSPVGDLLNITPTIADILGCKDDVLSSGLLASNQSLFDLM